jgi:hypothetical protein
MSTQNNNQQQQGNEADPNEQFGAIVRRISAGLNSLKLAGILARLVSRAAAGLADAQARVVA